jgi:sporulation protein YlmC with PRC-barrel domain
MVTGDDMHDLISAGKVQGTAVYNLEGERLGHVEDIMLHKVSGKVAYAVMAFGGFLGRGGKSHPLPWTILKYDTDKRGYVVPLSRVQLEEAPAMVRAELGEDDASWGERVHAYYQVTPSWM